MSKPSLMLEINIPAPGLRPGAGFLHAYIENLIKEIEACSEDLAEYDIKSIYIRNAGSAPDSDLIVLTRTLNHTLDISKAEKVIEIAPERITTANFTTWRNFYTDIYRINLGSLNYVDFNHLGVKYDYNLHTWIGKLLSYSKMTNICVEHTLGLKGQSVPSLTDSLNRVMALSPDAVCFIPQPQGAAPQKTPAAALLEAANSYLLERDYHRVSLYEYAKPEKYSLHTILQNTDCEYWGLGFGAVSFIDGCILTNTADVDKYISAEGDADKLIARAVRLDEKSLMQNYAVRGLNAAAGLKLPDFADRFGNAMDPAFDRLISEGLAENADDHLAVTFEGAANMPKVQQIISGAADV